MAWGFTSGAAAPGGSRSRSAISLAWTRRMLRSWFSPTVKRTVTMV
jgi:hypothetical protein